MIAMLIVLMVVGVCHDGGGGDGGSSSVSGCNHVVVVVDVALRVGFDSYNKVVSRGGFCLCDITPILSIGRFKKMITK